MRGYQFINTLFDQCNISLNRVTIIHAADLYYYRAYLETLLSYGNEAAESHLTNAFWYRDTGDLGVCDPTASVTPSTNKGFLARCDRLKRSKEIEIVGGLHSDICNVPKHSLPGVRMQKKLRKARREIYVLGKEAHSKAVFKILDAQLLVKRVRPNPAYLIEQNTALQAGAIARYNMTRVEIKNFTHAKGSQSLSIDNSILGPIPKRLLFVMIDNTNFLGTLDTNPFDFHHYDMTYLTLYLNGKQIPSGGLHLDTAREKESVMAYRTLFEGSGIRHSNTGLHISHASFVNGYFMLLFEGHTSHPDSGNIRIEARFAKVLPVAITCLLYLEYNSCVRIDSSRNVTTNF